MSASVAAMVFSFDAIESAIQRMPLAKVLELLVNCERATVPPPRSAK